MVGKETINYFLSNFINSLYSKCLNLNLNTFKTSVVNNLNPFFNYFTYLFPSFKLNIDVFKISNLYKT